MILEAFQRYKANINVPLKMRHLEILSERLLPLQYKHCLAILSFHFQNKRKKNESEHENSVLIT